jgi:hypothetical protein
MEPGQQLEFPTPKGVQTRSCRWPHPPSYRTVQHQEVLPWMQLSFEVTLRKSSSGFTGGNDSELEIDGGGEDRISPPELLHGPLNSDLNFGRGTRWWDREDTSHVTGTIFFAAHLYSLTDMSQEPGDEARQLFDCKVDLPIRCGKFLQGPTRFPVGDIIGKSRQPLNRISPMELLRVGGHHCRRCPRRLNFLPSWPKSLMASIRSSLVRLPVSLIPRM